VSGSDEDFSYLSTGTAKVLQKIQAIEVRYILFGVFGQHFKTLQSVEVADIEPSHSYDLSGSKWSAWQNDVSHFLSSVAFVSAVRTADGKIWRYNQKAVTDELERIQLKAADIDLNPKEVK